MGVKGGKTRTELVEELLERDGTECALPECTKPLDNEVSDGPMFVTIEHWMPQWWCKEEGWTTEEIWDLSNLRLAHKRCNAIKGQRVPNPDGTLPPKKRSKFLYRREKRAQRPEICDACMSGRNLQEGEWCNACGSGPQPARFPKWRQMKPSECDHDLFFCVGCTVWFPEKRRSALDALITGGEGYE